MQNLAKKMDRDAAEQRAGYVVRAEGPALLVRVDGKDRTAQRALSCLVDPVQGDRVLLALLGDGATFVLAVLERTEAAGVTASLPGDLSLRLSGGKLEVVSRDGVGVISPGEVSIASGSFELGA